MAYLQQCLACLEDVPDANGLFDQPLGREVLAEPAEGEPLGRQRLPLLVVLGGEAVDRLIRPAVVYLVRVLVAVQPQLAGQNGIADRLLMQRGFQPFLSADAGICCILPT